MDHRLGYPAVLRALFGAPAARMLPVYAAWPPIGGTTEGDKASTAEHDAKNAPKPVKRDEPYRPEFDFQYVDRKGHLSDTVIPKRPAPAALRGPDEAPTFQDCVAAVNAAIARGASTDERYTACRRCGVDPQSVMGTDLDTPEQRRAYVAEMNALRSGRSA